MRTKKEISVLNAELKMVLNTLRGKNKGILSLEIAKLTGFSSKKTRQLLIRLRNDNKVSCSLTNDRKNVRLWALYGVYKSEQDSQIYPDLDAQHEEWYKRVITKKTVYNPWGRKDNEPNA